MTDEEIEKRGNELKEQLSIAICNSHVNDMLRRNLVTLYKEGTIDENNFAQILREKLKKVLTNERAAKWNKTL